MIDYSIIIPHKNTPNLLQFCLDSIPLREDVQVIVVDDNSSADIVNFERFPKRGGVHYEYYLTKEGKGAGYARNVGLRHAEGQWVLFVGADDFLLPNVSEILDREKDTKADIIYFRPKAVMLEDRVTESQRASSYNDLIDQFIQSSDDSQLRCRWLSDTNKFYRLQLIKDNGISFDEILYSNDNVFSVKAAVCANKIAVRDYSFYCITESRNSLTSNFMKKPGELSIRGDAFFRAQEILHNYGYPVDESRALSFLRKLFSSDRNAFILNFNRLLKMGYKKFWLLREVFKNNGKIAAFKRRVYAFFCTGI